MAEQGAHVITTLQMAKGQKSAGMVLPASQKVPFLDRLYRSFVSAGKIGELLQQGVHGFRQ